MRSPTQLPLFTDHPLSEDELHAGTTLQATVGLFQRHLQRAGKSQHTISAFTSDLQLLIEYAGATARIGELTTTSLNAYLEWMEHGRGIPCSRKTYARRVTTLKVYFKWLHSLGAIAHDPAVPILQRSGPAPLSSIITEDEINAVLLHTGRLRHAEKPDARPDLLFRLLIDTGIKKSEVMRLVPSDVESGNPPLLLVRQKNARDAYKERRIALSPVWLSVLNEYLQQYQPSGPIFNCTARNLEYVLEDIGYAAGLNCKLSFEMLRWSCAVRDFRAGIEPDHIREKLGLSRISWVETYAKIQMLARGESNAVDLVSDDDINSADQ